MHMRPLSGKGSHLLGGILHRKQPLATGAGAFAQERGGSAAAAAASAAAAAPHTVFQSCFRVGTLLGTPVLQLTSEPFDGVCVLCVLG
jgi:hypothetical protein